VNKNRVSGAVEGGERTATAVGKIPFHPMKHPETLYQNSRKAVGKI